MCFEPRPRDAWVLSSRASEASAPATRVYLLLRAGRLRQLLSHRNHIRTRHSPGTRSSRCLRSLVLGDWLHLRGICCLSFRGTLDILSLCGRIVAARPLPSAVLNFNFPLPHDALLCCAVTAAAELAVGQT